MIHVYEVTAGDFSAAGEISSRIKKTLRQLGLDGSIVRRASIACYETELNLIIHSVGGTIKFEVTPTVITITAEDKGPGIEDIELAMSEGYSTASEEIRSLGFGAGMGLPNIKRCADKLDIKSVLGKGTILKFTININD